MSAIYALVVRSGVPTLERIGTGLEAMQRLVGGYIEAVPLSGSFAGLTMWVNEEGRLNDLPRRPCPIWQHEPNIAGDYFVTRGTDDGELASITASDVEKLKQAFGGAL